MNKTTLLEVWASASEEERSAFLRFIAKPKKPTDPTALEKIIFAAEAQQVKRDRKRV